MAQDLRRDRMIVGLQFGRGLRGAHHLGQRSKAGQHVFPRNAIVDQAGDLVHADALELFCPRDGIVDRAEQAAVVEVPLEGEIQDGIQFLGLKPVKLQVKGVVHAFGPLERREGPGVLLDQPCGGTQIGLHRPARDLARVIPAVAQIGVQHQRDGKTRRIVPRLAQRGMVQRDLLGNLVDRLAQKVRQHVAALGTRLLPGLGVARRGHPDRQFPGHRAGLRHDLVHLAVGAGEPDRLSAPQPAQLVDVLRHGGFVVRRRILGAQDEVVRLPAAGNGQSRAPVRQVVDDRPFLGNAGGMVQRCHNRTRAHPDVARDGGHGSAGHRRVRIGPAKGMEMPFRRPDRNKAVFVGKLRAFQQQAVFVTAHAIVVAPVVDRELHPVAARAQRPVRDQPARFVRGHHHGKPARGRVEQFKNRNVERQRCDGKPGAALRVVHHVVHAGIKVQNVAMLDHHALGLASRSGGVDQIGQIRRRAGLGEVFVGCVVQRWFGIQNKQLRVVARQVRLLRRKRHDDRRPAVLYKVFQPVGRIARVHRQIGAAGLQNGQRPDQKRGPARAAQADNRIRPHTHLAQDMRRLVGACVQRGIAQTLILKDHRRGVWRARHLRLERAMHDKRAVVLFCCGVPPVQGRVTLGPGQCRQGVKPRLGRSAQNHRQPRREQGGAVWRQAAAVETERATVHVHRQRRARDVACASAQANRRNGGRSKLWRAVRQVRGKPNPARAIRQRRFQLRGHILQTALCRDAHRRPGGNQSVLRKVCQGLVCKGQIKALPIRHLRGPGRNRRRDQTGVRQPGVGQPDVKRQNLARGSGVARQARGRQIAQPRAPPLVVRRDLRQPGLKRCNRRVVGTLQTCTHRRDVARRCGSTVQMRQAGQGQRTIRTGHGQRVAIRGQHGAWRAFAGNSARLGHQPKAAVRPDLGNAQRVPVSAMIQSLHQPGQIGGGTVEP